MDQVNSRSIKASGKSISLSKAINKVVTKELAKYGYIYDKRYTRHGLHVFYKEVNGFNIGLEISKGNYDNSLNLNLNTSAPPPPPGSYSSKNIYYLLKGMYKEPDFSSQQDLEDILKEVLNLFINEGRYWVEQYCLEVFNPFPIYETDIDYFFNKYKYNRVFTDINLLVGGKAIYSNGSKQFIFQHHWVAPGVTCLVDRNGLEENLGIFIKEFRDCSYIGYGFKDQATYIESLNKLLKYIEQSGLI